MSTAREKMFVCTFTYRNKQRIAHVLAWDERQAAEIFREELDEAGGHARGSIKVTPALAPMARPFELHADLG